MVFKQFRFQSSNFRLKELTLSISEKHFTKTVSLRLPEFILEEIKMIANKKDIPYQSLYKNLFERTYF